VLTPVIIIADKQNLFIEGLASIVREKFTNVKLLSARTIGELIEQLEQTNPQIVFLNYSFIPAHFHSIRPILARKGYPEIIVICDEWSDEARKQSASLGVLSVISKQCNSDDIWQQLDRFTDSNSATEDFSNLNSQFLKHKTSTLTSRQRKILQLLACGMTNREISDRVGCAETTVKAHLNTAYKILGVKNRTQAMYVISQTAPPTSDIA